MAVQPVIIVHEQRTVGRNNRISIMVAIIGTMIAVSCVCMNHGHLGFGWRHLLYDLFLMKPLANRQLKPFFLAKR